MLWTRKEYVVIFLHQGFLATFTFYLLTLLFLNQKYVTCLLGYLDLNAYSVQFTVAKAISVWSKA